jgi:hypothetical protein
MDQSSKIALSIIAAGVLLVVGFIAYSEFLRQRAMRDAEAIVESFHEAVVAGQEQSRQEAQARWRIQQTIRRSETLAPNQQCVGGVVVQVDGNRYTQLGTIASPIHCQGRMADTPLR